MIYFYSDNVRRIHYIKTVVTVVIAIVCCLLLQSRQYTKHTIAG